jgi:hypothetical protein
MAYTECHKGDQQWGIIARLYLSREELNTDTIAHEAVHLASGYFARRGIPEFKPTEDIASDEEELFAELVGVLTERIIKQIPEQWLKR